MTELRKMVISILSTSGWVALEVAILLGFALLIVQSVGPENVRVEIQAGIVVAVVIIGGMVLEIVRRRLIEQNPIEVQEVAGNFWIRTRIILERAIQGLVSSISARSLTLIPRNASHRDVLVPALSKELSDFGLFLVAEDHREEVKNLVVLVAEKLRQDAKGRSIKGIAVLPAERDRLIHYPVFWYMIAEELNLRMAVRFDWVEPMDIKVGLPSCIGKLDKSDYVAVFRVASLGDELEREVPDWLAKTTGAKVGPVRYVTLAKSLQSV